MRPNLQLLLRAISTDWSIAINKLPPRIRAGGYAYPSDNNANFASAWAGMESSVNAALEKTMEQFK